MKSMRGELEKALSNVGRDFEEDLLGAARSGPFVRFR